MLSEVKHDVKFSRNDSLNFSQALFGADIGFTEFTVVLVPELPFVQLIELTIVAILLFILLEFREEEICICISIDISCKYFHELLQNLL